MLVLCRVDGAGTEEDPYHLPLPRYRLVAIDYESRQAVAAVAEADVPADLEDRLFSAPWLPGGPQHVRVIPADYVGIA